MIVDEADIVTYYTDDKGNQKKKTDFDQFAYYEVVKCNRQEIGIHKNAQDGVKSYAEWGCGDVGDLNGDVGQQWLALYAERNNNNQPILADSLKVLVNDDKVPSGYTTGIHFLGTTAAENLNNTMYVWNSSAPKIYVYFKTEESAGAEGSSFTWGYLALAGGAGLLIGAVVTAVCMTAAKKKKKDNTESE